MEYYPQIPNWYRGNPYVYNPEIHKDPNTPVWVRGSQNNPYDTADDTPNHVRPGKVVSQLTGIPWYGQADLSDGGTLTGAPTGVGGTIDSLAKTKLQNSLYGALKPQRNIEFGFNGLANPNSTTKKSMLSAFSPTIK